MIGIRTSRAAIVTLWLPAAVSALLLTPTAGRAEQFVLFDVTFTFTKMDADNSTPSKSHYYVRGAAMNRMIQVSAGSKYDPNLVPHIPHDIPTDKLKDGETPVTGVK